MTFQRPFLAVVGLTVFAACSDVDADTAGAAASNITHQDSQDITVLKIERLPGYVHISQGAAVATGEKPNVAGFDPQSCTPRASGKLDCTAEFEKAFDVHALATIVVSSQSTLCQPLKITTVSKRAAFENSKGIGGYVSVEPDNTDRGRLVSAADLGSGAAVRLKADSEVVDGVVHEFGTLGFCDKGGRFGTSVFKPYMRFTDGGGGLHDNWDGRVPNAAKTDFSGSNYGVTWNDWQLDRTSELIE